MKIHNLARIFIRIPRKIVVAMGQMMSRVDLMQARADLRH
jgi:hypothetical protein